MVYRKAPPPARLPPNCIGEESMKPFFRARCFLIIFVSFFGIILLCGCADSIPPVSEATKVEFEGSLQVTIDWDSAADADAYNVYISTFPGALTKGQKVSNAAKPITITDLETGKTYYFAVTAISDLKEIMESEEVSYTASEKIGWLHLKFPQKEKAAQGSGKMTLAWDNVQGALSYNIYWSDKPGVNKDNGTKITDVKNPHTITGLKRGVTYYFVVSAVSNEGESVVSKEVSYSVP